MQRNVITAALLSAPQACEASHFPEPGRAVLAREARRVTDLGRPRRLHGPVPGAGGIATREARGLDILKLGAPKRRLAKASRHR